MRRLGVRLLWLGLTLAPLAWFCLTNPMALPVLKLGTEGVAARLDAAVARASSDGTLEARLAEAVETGDAFAAEALLEIAEARGVVLPEALEMEAHRLTGRGASKWQERRACLACAVEIRHCQSVKQIAVCAFPVELSPLGDANALRRQAGNAIVGAPVDELEAGLAVVGLAATTVVIATGGSSAMVKLGASTGRLARRMGALTPGLQRTIGVAADVPIRWGKIDDWLLRRVDLDAVTDTAKLARLGGYARGFGAIAENTSAADTLILLRHVDDGPDIARMVRVTEAAGDRTRQTFALLDKSRVFRALDEIGTALRWIAALGAAVMAQLALWVVKRAIRAVRCSHRRRVQTA